MGEGLRDRVKGFLQAITPLESFSLCKSQFPTYNSLPKCLKPKLILPHESVQWKPPCLHAATDTGGGGVFGNQKLWLLSVVVSLLWSFYPKRLYRHTDLSKLPSTIGVLPYKYVYTVGPQRPVLFYCLQQGSIQQHLMLAVCSMSWRIESIVEFIQNETNQIKQWGLGSEKWKRRNEQKHVRLWRIDLLV